MKPSNVFAIMDIPMAVAAPHTDVDPILTVEYEDEVGTAANVYEAISDDGNLFYVVELLIGGIVIWYGMLMNMVNDPNPPIFSSRKHFLELWKGFFDDTNLETPTTIKLAVLRMLAVREGLEYPMTFTAKKRHFQWLDNQMDIVAALYGFEDKEADPEIVKPFDKFINELDALDDLES